MRRTAATAALLLLVFARPGWADDRYEVRGLVLRSEPEHHRFVASIEPIPGFMPAMAMPFAVRDAAELAGVVPGAVVHFTLVVGGQTSRIEGLTVERYETVEQDPLNARRLALLKLIASGRPPAALAVGAPVPDFTLIDQRDRPVTLSDLRGRVVAVNFMYTTCQLPDYCLRLVNHFAVLRKRFARALGPDLVFLTISFDPVRDTPEVLAEYAQQWDADPATWHFLTGAAADVQRVLDLFAVSAFPAEGLMDHSLHTVVIDRTGRLAANIEGNQYTTDQLGDLIAETLGGGVGR